MRLRHPKQMAFFCALVLTASCATIIGTDTSFTPWQGDQLYKGDGGAVEEIDGIEFWKVGEPERPYRVIGLINQSKPDHTLHKILFNGFDRKQVTDIVKNHQGNGVVTLKSERFLSGYSTQMSPTQYGATMNVPRFANASMLAVFRYVDSDSDTRPTQ